MPIAPFFLGRWTPRPPSTALFALIVGATGCKTRSNDYLVGSFLSLSGPDSTFGSDTRDGIELAVHEINAAGGVKGKKIRVIYEDDQSNVQEASNKVRQLIDRDKVLALVGEVASSRSMAGGLIANTKHVPMVTPSSIAVEVTKDRAYVFRSCSTDVQQGGAAAQFAIDVQKHKRAALLYVSQDTYSSSLAQSFRDEFIRRGGTIVIEKGYQKGETNFSTYLQDIKSANPDLIFAPNYYNDMVQVARQAKHLGISGALFMGGDGWDSSNLVEGAGAELEGAHLTTYYVADAPWPKAHRFLEQFDKRYGHPPNSISAQGYEAIKLVADALERASEATPAAIRDALESTKNFSGGIGVLSIDHNHNAIKPVVIVEIKGNQFHYTSEIIAR